MPDERCLFEIGLEPESTGGAAGCAAMEREGCFTIRGSAGESILGKRAASWSRLEWKTMQNLHEVMRPRRLARLDPGSPGRRAFIGLATVGVFGLARAQVAGRPPVRVVAASDLQFALPELAARFGRETGQPVALNFGSSGKFAQCTRPSP